MEFLKELFGEKALTYAELETALKDSDKIKIANLAGGAYVGKEEFDSKDQELVKANELIEQLKTANTGDADLQAKVANYEKDVAALQTELHKERIDNALKVALLEAEVKDVDYITYRIKSNETELALDDNGHIKGIDNLIKDQKTAYPDFFKQASKTEIIENKLPPQDDGSGSSITPEQFKKMGYNELNKLNREQPDVYAELTGKQ